MTLNIFKILCINIIYILMSNKLIIIICGQQLYEGSSCFLPQNEIGVCKHAINCKWAIDGIQHEGDSFFGKIRELHCAWSNDMEIICCPNLPDIPNRNDPDTMITPSTVTFNVRKSTLACNSYSDNYISPLLVQNIFGGTSAILGEFPHMVGLGYETQEVNKQYDFRCGGSLISDRYILTAGHCIKPDLPLIARLGKVSINDDEDGEVAVDRQIKSIIPYPGYTTTRQYNDIALMLIDPPIVNFTYNIRPACLRTDIADTEANTQLLVTGWGDTELNKRSNLLLKTNLTAVPLQNCNTSVFGYNRLNPKLKDGLLKAQICAHDSKQKNDICFGDSGGPLQITDDKGISTILGITSFSISCVSPLPTVFTRVAFYLDWIESIVWKD